MAQALATVNRETRGLTLRTELRGGSGTEADTAVTLGGLLSRLGRRANGSPLVSSCAELGAS